MSCTFDDGSIIYMHENKLKSGLKSMTHVERNIEE